MPRLTGYFPHNHMTYFVMKVLPKIALDEIVIGLQKLYLFS